MKFVEVLERDVRQHIRLALRAVEQLQDEKVNIDYKEKLLDVQESLNVAMSNTKSLKNFGNVSGVQA